MRLGSRSTRVARLQRAQKLDSAYGGAMAAVCRSNVTTNGPRTGRPAGNLTVVGRNPALATATSYGNVVC
jgi:hypothetical protein